MTRVDGTTEELPPVKAVKSPAPKRRGKLPTKPAAEPVPIEQVSPGRTGFVPANQREGAQRGWTRNGQDSLPRGKR